MNSGVPPTARKARTGEFTPPGITPAGALIEGSSGVVGRCRFMIFVHHSLGVRHGARPALCRVEKCVDGVGTGVFRGGAHARRAAGARGGAPRCDPSRSSCSRWLLIEVRSSWRSARVHFLGGDLLEGIAQVRELRPDRPRGELAAQPCARRSSIAARTGARRSSCARRCPCARLRRVRPCRRGESRAPGRLDLDVGRHAEIDEQRRPVARRRRRRSRASASASSTGSLPPAASTRRGHAAAGRCGTHRATARARTPTVPAPRAGADGAVDDGQRRRRARAAAAAQRRVIGETPTSADGPGCALEVLEHALGREIARARERGRGPSMRCTRRAMPSASPSRRSSIGPQMRALRAPPPRHRAAARRSPAPRSAPNPCRRRRSNRCSTAASPVQARRVRAASPGCESRPVRTREHVRAGIAGRAPVARGVDAPRRDCRCRRRGFRRHCRRARSAGRRARDLRPRHGEARDLLDPRVAIRQAHDTDLVHPGSLTVHPRDECHRMVTDCDPGHLTRPPVPLDTPAARAAAAAAAQASWRARRGCI